jgi:hypothetical protein
MNPIAADELRESRMGTARRFVIPPHRFENSAKTAIQHHPQESLGVAGISASTVDGVWTPKRESNPPRNNHYN